MPYNLPFVRRGKTKRKFMVICIFEWNPRASWNNKVARTTIQSTFTCPARECLKKGKQKCFHTAEKGRKEEKFAESFFLSLTMVKCGRFLIGREHKSFSLLLTTSYQYFAKMSCWFYNFLKIGFKFIFPLKLRIYCCSSVGCSLQNPVRMASAIYRFRVHLLHK